MKIIARELLWLLIAILLAAPIAFLFEDFVSLKPEASKFTIQEDVFQMEFFLIGYLVGIVCVYIMRAVMWAVKTYIID